MNVIGGYGAAKRRAHVNEAPAGRIGIIDRDGHYRGHVGPRASQATVARFGVRGAKLKRVKGKQCWIGE